MPDLNAIYRRLIIAANADLLSPDVPALVVELDRASREVLQSAQQIPLHYSGPKRYSSYKLAHQSRAINDDLFDIELPEDHIEAYINRNFDALGHGEAARTLYTLALSFCAATDTLKSGNKKGPATFFEKFIGNLFAREIGVQPKQALEMLDDESLATDYIYMTGEREANIHLQVKLSTRERAIEAWAHQRIINGIFGETTYRGVLVVGSETNVKNSGRGVVEVCVPGQWILYQKFIAQIRRVYYLDVPTRLIDIGVQEPLLQIKQLSEFFFEKDRVLSQDLS